MAYRAERFSSQSLSNQTRALPSCLLHDVFSTFISFLLLLKWLRPNQKYGFLNKLSSINDQYLAWKSFRLYISHLHNAAAHICKYIINSLSFL